MWGNGWGDGRGMGGVETMLKYSLKRYILQATFKTKMSVGMIIDSFDITKGNLKYDEKCRDNFDVRIETQQLQDTCFQQRYSCL